MGILTGRGADETGADVEVALVHRADVARVRVVVEQFWVVSTKWIAIPTAQ